MDKERGPGRTTSSILTVPTQAAFDAEIDVAVADLGLYLIVGRGAPETMQRALRSVGAVIAASISSTRALVVLTFSAFEAMRVHRDIALVGPVNLDPDRFDLFQRLVGLEVDTE